MLMKSKIFLLTYEMIISENIDPFFIIYFIILTFLNIIKNLTEEVALYHGITTHGLFTG